MMCVWQQKADTLVNADGDFDLPKAKTAFKHKRGWGQVGRPSDAGKGKDARGMAELTNAIQKFFIENSRLGIPVIFHEEFWTAMRLESQLSLRYDRPQLSNSGNSPA